MSSYFSWVIPDEELLFSDGFIKEVKRPETLNDFKYNQSSKQAFYFIDKINLDDIALTPDDWIIAYNNNIVVGARKWNGRYTDIPAMGYDGYSSTLGYCEDADIPDFNGFWKEQLGEQRNYEKIINGLAWQIMEVKYALFPLRVGKLIIPKTTLFAQILVPDRNKRNRRKKS